MQSKDNKQGSSGFIDEETGSYLSAQEKVFLQEARQLYEERVGLGMAREQARKDLPLSTYTEAYWKIDLHNLFHFLRLRMDSHAQSEISEYANAMFELIKPIVPMACEAFEDFRLESVFLSKAEIEILRNPKVLDVIIAVAKSTGIKDKMSMGEIKEFKKKLNIKSRLTK